MAELLSLTEQLQRFSGGERGAAEAVLREVLPKLHQIAVRELHRERCIAPLSPTELINEVWLRSIGKGGWQIGSREHFYAIASLAMRRVLVDFARTRSSQRRRHHEESLTGFREPSLQASILSNPEGLLQMGLLMDRLEKTNLEWARIVDMHYFAGFTLNEIADITGLTLRQVRLRWEKGSDWLKDNLR
jgi:RNA polymerase sigma factor (TIGR02999 family)